MIEADEKSEIVFLHADTIFESQRVTTPRTVRGQRYDITSLVSERSLLEHVHFVWHGVNDAANLRQMLASEVHWGECDVRIDPIGRTVLRHDSFEATPLRLLRSDAVAARGGMRDPARSDWSVPAP